MYRMLYFSPAQRRFDDYINDESAHPISGVLFVLIWFLHPKGCFLFFVEGVPDISYNGKSINAKGDFYDDRSFSILVN